MLKPAEVLLNVQTLSLGDQEEGFIHRLPPGGFQKRAGSGPEWPTYMYWVLAVSRLRQQGGICVSEAKSLPSGNLSSGEEADGNSSRLSCIDYG